MACLKKLHLRLYCSAHTQPYYTILNNLQNNKKGVDIIKLLFKKNSGDVIIGRGKNLTNIDIRYLIHFNSIVDFMSLYQHSVFVLLLDFRYCWEINQIFLWIYACINIFDFDCITFCQLKSYKIKQQNLKTTWKYH